MKSAIHFATLHASLAGDAPMRETSRGVMPFRIFDFSRVGLPILFPSLSPVLIRIFS